MRVQVWRAPGSPTPGTDYADRLVARLAADGLDAEVRPVGDLARVVPERGSCHVLTGGEVPVRTRRVWPRGFVGGVRRLARAGEDGSACVLGICFGAQVLADALTAGPGAIGRLPTLRVGLTDVAMHDGSGEQAVPAFHYERVHPRFTDRAGVRTLATASFPAVQAYAAGAALRGYQFHPELDADDVVAVAEAHVDLLAAFGQHPDEVAVEASLARDRLDPRLFTRTISEPLLAYLADGPTSRLRVAASRPATRARRVPAVAG